MLDILVIAPHPDDAELGAAGAILKFKEEGAKVGVLDLTSGEPTPFGTLEKRAAETAAATKILGLDWRENLGLPNRSLEPTLEARRAAGDRHSPDAAEMAVCAVLGRCASRSCGGDAARRGGPLLGQADQDRHAGRAVASAADFQLLLRASEARRPAGVCSRHQPLLGAKSWRPFAAITASSSRAAAPSRRRFSISFATKRPTGARRIGAALRRAVYLPRADRPGEHAAAGLRLRYKVGAFRPTLPIEGTLRGRRAVLCRARHDDASRRQPRWVLHVGSRDKAIDR